MGLFDAGAAAVGLGAGVYDGAGMGAAAGGSPPPAGTGASGAHFAGPAAPVTPSYSPPSTGGSLSGAQFQPVIDSGPGGKDAGGGNTYLGPGGDGSPMGGADRGPLTSKPGYAGGAGGSMMVPRSGLLATPDSGTSLPGMGGGDGGLSTFKGQNGLADRFAHRNQAVKPASYTPGNGTGSIPDTMSI